MMRTLSNYADHPNVGGVILIDLGCEKTNLSFVEKYLTKREKPIQKPVFKIGIQDVGGTQAAIEIGLKACRGNAARSEPLRPRRISGQRAGAWR